MLTKKHFTSSISYYYDHLVWCVQKAKRIPISEVVFHICTDWVVFVVFALHALLLTAYAYVMQQFERHPKWDLYRISETGFRIYAGFGCPYKPKNTSHRIFAAAVFLGAFLFNVILCAKVILFLTTSIQDIQIKSNEEIVKGSFQLSGDRFAYKQILQQNQVPLKSLFYKANNIIFFISIKIRYTHRNC